VRGRLPKLPLEIVQRLNDLGRGGRMVYVPLLKASGNTRQVIVASMLDCLKQGLPIDLDEYRGLEISGRTLYRWQEQAIREYKLWKKQEQLIESDGHGDDHREEETAEPALR
jgi:hypothetical protein